MNSIEEVRANCVIDPVTHCWLWQGPVVKRGGGPRIYAVDLDAVTKRVMPGTRAVWYLAHNEPLNGRMVFRSCQVMTCLCPAHLKTAWTKAEIGTHQRRLGSRKGTHVALRRAAIKLAMAANGITPTPEPIVRAVYAAPPEVTHTSLAKQYGIALNTVSRIRRGLSHRELLEATA